MQFDSHAYTPDSIELFTSRHPARPLMSQCCNFPSLLDLTMVLNSRLLWHVCLSRKIIQYCVYYINGNKLEWFPNLLFPFIKAFLYPVHRFSFGAVVMAQAISRVQSLSKCLTGEPDN